MAFLQTHPLTPLRLISSTSTFLFFYNILFFSIIPTQFEPRVFPTRKFHQLAQIKFLLVGMKQLLTTTCLLIIEEILNV